MTLTIHAWWAVAALLILGLGYWLRRGDVKGMDVTTYRCTECRARWTPRPGDTVTSVDGGRRWRVIRRGLVQHEHDVRSMVYGHTSCVPHDARPPTIWDRIRDAAWLAR